MSFCEWFMENIHANLFTLGTVILSGFISLGISHLYYRFSNRNNVKISVIYPVCQILKNQINSNDYKTLEKISTEYSVRYLKKGERNQFLSLKNAYKKVVQISEIDLYTKIFSFYFIYILEKNGVDTKFIPTEYDDVTIYEYPPELEYMDLKLKKFFRDNPVDVWDDLRYYSGEDIEQKLDEIYQEFAYSCYRISNINFLVI